MRPVTHRPFIIPEELAKLTGDYGAIAAEAPRVDDDTDYASMWDEIEEALRQERDERECGGWEGVWLIIGAGAALAWLGIAWALGLLS